MLQENVITLRNNRYVIPVKEQYRSMIKGFVHDMSSSGSTVFIEPMNIFELNNQLHFLQAEESLEIQKILRNLSSLFTPYIKELMQDYLTIGHLDFIFAKAKYALATNSIFPEINQKKYLQLIDAKHPLLDEDIVVPICIEIGKTFSSLLITGPNTRRKNSYFKNGWIIVSNGL